eukprot:g4696.t1
MYYGAQRDGGQLDDEKLIREVEKGHNIDTRFLVGSSPKGHKHRKYNPWKSRGYRVVAHKLRPQEKEQGVDSQLVAEMYKVLFHGTPSHNSTLILLSGDGNDNGGCASIYEAACKAIELNWRVIVYTWRRGCNRKYHDITIQSRRFQEATRNGRYRVVYLEDLGVTDMGTTTTRGGGDDGDGGRKLGGRKIPITTHKSCRAAIYNLLERADSSLDQLMTDVCKLRCRMPKRQTKLKSTTILMKNLIAVLAEAGDANLLKQVGEEAPRFFENVDLRTVVQTEVDGYTPLNRALYAGCWNAAKVLLDMGADLHNVNKEGESVFEMIDEGKKAAMKKSKGRTEKNKVRIRYKQCRDGLDAFLRSDNSDDEGDEKEEEDHSVSSLDLDKKIEDLWSMLDRLEETFRAHEKDCETACARTSTTTCHKRRALPHGTKKLSQMYEPIS